MPLMFNTILSGAGLPLDDVCLLRHKDERAEKGRTRHTRPKVAILRGVGPWA